MIRRFRAWRRRRYVAKHNENALREFVYLDDVSVYSLIVSRLGPIAAEFTDTQSRSFKGNVGGTGEIGVPDVSKAGASASAEFSLGSSSQVLRRANAQSTFRELYQFEQKSLALRAPTSKDKLPRDVTLDGLPNLPEPWVVPASSVSRGQLVELEIGLEAEPIFQFQTLVQTVTEVVKASPHLFSSGERELAEAVEIGDLLDRLLVGLVPISGVATNYSVLEVGGLQYLVHSSILSRLPDETRLQAVALRVAGVGERQLFWKDLRQLLFARSRFTVFARISRDGVHEDWTPVKLVDLFDGVSDDIPAAIREISAGGLPALAAAARQPRVDVPKFDVEVVARTFIQASANLLAVTMEGDELKALVEQAVPLMEFEDISVARESFDSVLKLIPGGDTLDRNLVPNLRDEAMKAGALKSAPAPVNVAPSDEESSLILDCELIAIYW